MQGSWRPCILNLSLSNRKERRMTDHKDQYKDDYETPMPKQEYIKLLKETQGKTGDRHMQREIEREIRHVKEHGSNDGLKR